MLMGLQTGPIKLRARKLRGRRQLGRSATVSHRRFIDGEWACRKVRRSMCGLEMSEKAKAVL